MNALAADVRVAIFFFLEPNFILATLEEAELGIMQMVAKAGRGWLPQNMFTRPIKTT